ncbi:MAG TPA: carbohydrate kinase family protein, partial [Fimbriimonas sp.]|nr:carbohydrate kinase family protein [Fimbriimonas sp.]
VSNFERRSTSLVTDALRHVDIAFMNELELGFVADCEIGTDESPESIGEKTKSVFAGEFEGVLVMHSAKNAHMITSQGVQHSAKSIQLPPERIKGTVGAGDAFAAGYLMAHLQGHSPQTALQWAAAAGASCLLGEGASNGVLPIEEALGLLKGTPIYE